MATGFDMVIQWVTGIIMVIIITASMGNMDIQNQPRVIIMKILKSVDIW